MYGASICYVEPAVFDTWNVSVLASVFCNACATKDIAKNMKCASLCYMEPHVGDTRNVLWDLCAVRCKFAVGCI